MSKRHPFFARAYEDRDVYYTSVDDRLHAVRSFDRVQCEAALRVDGLQKTVEQAVRRRMRKLDREARA